MLSSGFAARAQSAGDRWASSHSTTGDSSSQDLADSHTNSYILDYPARILEAKERKYERALSPRRAVE